MNKDITPANIPTWCVPSSMFTATTWAMKTGNPVRIAIQNLEKGKDHSQAEAMINGKWTPLTEYWNGESMAVQPYQRHYPIEPYRYLGLSEWMAEQLPKQKVGE